ncbi:diaminopimelate epimerase [Marinospirillum alkaliphilum]|uniref:Diaminopimelate epimerase n=1 Tax=Marinospirillum alkaliphilum DSM 21637 TaxID=1122209 RepID=A0A1K1Y4Y5_9GAMM|nr:diaminopimelate epimerase [Marinospirillum alkaliphilum]SFX56643.1 diaminopimelate epimerase [Marinospirillum alkaliphilum DSM 21637]
MLLHFTKMHGLGNDFMVLDLISQKVRLRPEQIRRLADRHFGVGFDQLLTVEVPTTPDADFRYRIYNADGSEVENCGNGARCFAVFVHDRKLTNKNRLQVETAGGPLILLINDKGLVTVDMGVPRLQPDLIPFAAEHQAISYPLEVAGQSLEVGAVSMGNPHAVLRIDDVAHAPVAELGPQIENHPRFPKRVNAGFLQVVSRNQGRLRVFERGVGETLACGTGACAAMVYGRLQGWFDSRVEMQLPGGHLQLEWQGEGHPVMMTGPAQKVFEGHLHL